MTRASQLAGLEVEANSKLNNSLHTMLNNILKTSIVKATNGKVNLVLKHCNENSFTPGDLGRFVDRLRVEGYRTKMIFVDYVDVMTPSIARFNNSSEYDAQGSIVQELRALSRIHSIPVFSPTQNKRETENVTRMQSNESIGDSYKKIRYSDFIYMARMRNDLTFLHESVRPHVIPKKTLPDGVTTDFVSPEILKYKDKLVEVLVPFEIKITKSKDSEKDQSRFLLFCKDNLRIYNNIDEYLKDAPVIEANSNRLEKDVSILTELMIASVSTDDFSDNFIDDSVVVNFSSQF
jgi:hypothetical protein